MGDKLEKLKNKILKYKKIVIYGAGTNANPILTWLLETDDFHDIEISIAVTKPKVNEMFRGYYVNKIDDFIAERKNVLVLVAVFKIYEKDIDNKLRELGFENVIHIKEWFVDEAFYEPIKNEPINKKKVVVENFHGLGYGDSPKYIVDELITQKYDLDIVWIVKPGVEADFPTGIRTVEIYTKQFYYEIYTAKIWISNVRKYQSVRKRKGQYYIQTWHGFPLKRIEKDAEEISQGISAPYFDAGKKDSKMIDVLLSNSSFLTKLFKQTFWYNGEIVECGTPRNDIFFKENDHLKKKITDYYHLKNDSMILLYAPTFRNNYKENPFDIDIEKILTACEKKFGSEWVGFMRMHPNIANKSNLFQYSDKVVNVTSYPDIMELLYVADIVITDYSSIMFDFMITRKPIFLYSKDRQRYSNSDRGFYFDYDSLPFPISTTNEQLLSSIATFEDASYTYNIEQFSKCVGFCDSGSASETVVERIRKIIRE